ncbi:MAG: hypothetical protein ACE5DX_03285 [Candidatus Dojkabacteria bacterium]
MPEEGTSRSPMVENTDGVSEYSNPLRDYLALHDWVKSWYTPTRVLTTFDKSEGRFLEDTDTHLTLFPLREAKRHHLRGGRNLNVSPQSSYLMVAQREIYVSKDAAPPQLIVDLTESEAMLVISLSCSPYLSTRGMTGSEQTQWRSVLAGFVHKLNTLGIQFEGGIYHDGTMSVPIPYTQPQIRHSLTYLEGFPPESLFHMEQSHVQSWIYYRLFGNYSGVASYEQLAADMPEVTPRAVEYALRSVNKTLEAIFGIRVKVARSSRYGIGYILSTPDVPDEVRIAFLRRHIARWHYVEALLSDDQHSGREHFPAITFPRRDMPDGYPRYDFSVVIEDMLKPPALLVYDSKDQIELVRSMGERGGNVIYPVVSELGAGRTRRTMYANIEAVQKEIVLAGLPYVIRAVQGLGFGFVGPDEADTTRHPVMETELRDQLKKFLLSTEPTWQSCGGVKVAIPDYEVGDLPQAYPALIDSGNGAELVLFSTVEQHKLFRICIEEGAGYIDPVVWRNSGQKTDALELVHRINITTEPFLIGDTRLLKDIKPRGHALFGKHRLRADYVLRSLQTQYGTELDLPEQIVDLRESFGNGERITVVDIMRLFRAVGQPLFSTYGYFPKLLVVCNSEANLLIEASEVEADSITRLFFAGGNSTGTVNDREAITATEQSRMKRILDRIKLLDYNVKPGTGIASRKQLVLPVPQKEVRS